MVQNRIWAIVALGLLTACQTGIGWAKSEWDMVPDGAVMTEPYNADKTDLYGLPDKPTASTPTYSAEPNPYALPSLMEEAGPTERMGTEEEYTESGETPSYDWEAEDLERLGRPLTPEEEARLKDLMASNPS